jgi:peptidoglycan/xylan/chitin deacetylase (PgdA/CDA1 family)
VDLRVKPSAAASPRKTRPVKRLGEAEAWDAADVQIAAADGLCRRHATGPGTATVVVHVEPSADGDHRRYGLEQLLRVVGARPVFDPCLAPTIYYGSKPVVGATAALWIPAEPDRDDEDQPLRPIVIDGVPVLCRGPAPTRLFQDNRLTFDVAAATAFWLTLRSERHIAQRDSHGRVPARASLLAAGGRLDRPPVQLYANLLADRLRPHLSADAREPRWPDGKRYAVSLTHDVDDPESPNRLRRLFKEMLSDGPRPRRAAYWDIRAEIRRRGFLDAALAPSSRPIEWEFARFCKLEQQHGLRSAFYFAVVNRRGGHPLDVAYDASRAKYRNLLKRLSADGWELGLHAGYLTRLARPGVKWQVDRLTSLSGERVEGVRHHYLQLDRGAPMGSLVAHAGAGLSYDTSIGFNDEPGFRAGTALPFQPYDAATGLACPFVELPMSLADTHLPTHDEETAVEIVIRHLEAVRSLGGLAVLNWHVGHWYRDPAWRTAYQAACRFVAQDEDVWTARPGDVAQWWLTHPSRAYPKDRGTERPSAAAKG